MPIAPAKTPTKRRERRKDARPGELLAAALDLFTEKGFAGTRVDEVAARAGVSKGTLFLYFPSKEDLFKAVVRENIVGRLAEFAQEIDAFEGGSIELMRIAMHSWWDQVGSAKAGGISKLIMAESGNFPELAQFYFAEVIQPGNQLIEKILTRGVARRELQVANMAHTVHAFIAPMLHLTCWKHSISPCLPDEHQMDPLMYIESQINIVLYGISALTASAAPPISWSTPLCTAKAQP